MSNAASTSLMLSGCLMLAGCEAPAPTTAIEPQEADYMAAVQVSEQRVDQLMEIARSLRDRDPNMAWPVADAFWAEVRRRHPAGSTNDIAVDGWQRPLLYVREGDMRKLRIYSAGPNRKDEYGHVDDVALRQSETLIE